MSNWLKNKSNKKLLFTLILGIAFLGLFLHFDFAFAQEDTFGLQAVEQSNLNLAGGDLRITIGKIIRAVLGFLGIIAVGIVLYGGFIYMTAGGDQEKVTRARKILINGTIGLAIILASFLIVHFIIGRLSQAIFGGVDNPDCVGLEDCGGGPSCPGCGPGEDCFKSSVFIARSITPSQDSTGMNNIVIRGVFTQPVATPADQIFTVTKNDQDITSNVSFSFVSIENEDHQKKVVEGVYIAKDDGNNGFCEDPVNGDCFPLDSVEYEITLNDNVVSESGLGIDNNNNCGVNNAKFTVDAVKNDFNKPTFNYFRILASNGKEYSGSNIKLPAGRTYVIQAEAEDDSGIGYIHFQVSSNDGADSLERYDGPKKSDQPYIFEKTIFIGTGMPFDVVYSATVQAFDIDHNSEVASLQFSVAPAYCANGIQDTDKGETGIDLGGPCGGDEGGSCASNFDCADGLVCGPDNTCIGTPVILNVTPTMDGKQGNWITILGKYFGTTHGSIQFALNNGDDIYQESEWVDAEIVQCGSTETWKSSYVIAEVPDGFSTGDLASIRIKRSLGQSQASLPIIGKSVRLDGTNDYIFVPHNEVFNIAQNSELTLSAWIKPEKYGRTEIIRKGRYGTYNAYGMWSSFEQGKEDQGKFNCYFHPSTQPGILYQAEGTGLKFGQWNHVACRRVRNPADGQGRVEIFINGQSTGQSDWGADKLPAVENNDELFFGGIGLGASYTVNAFEGNLDEFSIFSKSLTEEQIAGFYDTGMHGNSIDYLNKINETGSLVAHWSFDDNSGTKAEEELQNLNADYVNGILLGEPGIFSINENILVFGNEVFLVDNTTNDVGPKPGPREGLFEFNNIVRPGLCSVEVLEDYTTTIDETEVTFNVGSSVGPPGAPIMAQGNGFSGNPELWFSDKKNADVLGIIFNDQGLDKITSEIPDNLQSGLLGVFVRSGGTDSNGIPFTIAQAADEVVQPDIVTIDPAQTTPGSYITLYGTDFGDIEGKVFAANSQNNVLTCGTENEHESCFQLNTNDFPPQCGSNFWTDKQVIAEIPEEVKEKGLFEDQIVENTNDFLTYAGFPPPHLIENESDPVSISAELLPGDDGKYDMNADWRMNVDVELRQEPQSGQSTTYGLWSAKVFGQANRYTNLILLDQNIDENSSSVVTFTFGNNGESISTPSFNRLSNRVLVNIDHSVTNNTITIVVGDPNSGAELARNEQILSPIAFLEEGSMLMGGINGYPISEMVLYSFTITTFETKSGGTVNIRLKRFDNQATKGEDILRLFGGNPLPSICRIDPPSGPAPLPEGDEGLKLFGVNFPKDPVVYFFQSGAQLNDLSTWLSSQLHKYKDQSVIKSSSAEEIVTLIPYDEATGNSMREGSSQIKVSDLNDTSRVSNFVIYTVTNCIDAEPIPGFQCCTEGIDAGRWKPESYTCAGEVKNAGYVWRFTTGLIPILPQVVEHCDQENWSADDEYPSPIPWQEWKQGTNVCLNASIAVRFNMEMSKASINADTIKVYACGQGPEAVCNIGTDDESLLDNLDIASFEDGGKILDIKKGTWDGQNILAENTWYRVVLYDGIVSVPQDFGIGREESVALKKTRPLEGFNNTTYFYDFKTGTGFCTLQSVGIYPPEKTASILGQIMADYELSLPFYYMLSGKADQECTMLSVKGMGWNWATEDSDKDQLERRAEVTEKIDDETKAGAEALLNAPEGVEIKAFAPVPTGSQLQAIFPDVDSISANPSILYISLGNPKAEYWEPECETACRNSSILVDFNRQMATETYPKGFHIYQCLDPYDPNCALSQEIQGILEEDFSTSTDRQLIFIPSFLFEKNTRYKVELTSDIKALERLNPRLLGKGLDPSHTWYFKTQDNDEPCKPAKLEITPDPFVAYMIGEKTKYTALPRQKTNECSKYGQLLNPNDYDYNWSTDPNSVVEITNYKLGHAIAPYCTENCLKRGSDVYSTAGVTNLYLCGNEVVDPGEDCDIGLADEIPGVSCGFNCLRPGNTAKGEGAGQCGNGTIDDKTKGEQCDPKEINTGNFCNPDNCLLLGASAQTEVGSCGDYNWTRNEACDRKLLLENTEDNPERSGIGCNEQCLHAGTKPIASFCRNATKPSDIEICKNALSVCGNGVLELGEECENPQSPECSNSCTLVASACGTTNQQCPAGTEGCDKNCILLGSSSIYSTPSVCGDGNVGIGENGACELEIGSSQSLASGPVQIATAVGEGEVDATSDKQEADIFVQLLETSISGKAKYYLQCGYEEFSPQGACEFQNLSCSTDQDCNFNFIRTNVATYYSAGQNVCVNSKDGAIWLNKVDSKPEQNIYKLFACTSDEGCAGSEMLTAGKGLDTILDDELENNNAAVFGEGENGGYYVCRKLNFESEKCVPGAIPSNNTVFNNCPNSINNNLGVAENSCCMPRPRRISEYPEDLTGLGGGVPVCPNTQISATFDHEINKNSLFDSITIVKGFETEVNCEGADVTDKIFNALALGELQTDKPSFFNRIWNKIKGFFARLFGGLVQAGEQQDAVSNIKTWCKTTIVANPQVHNQLAEVEGESVVVASTVLLNIQSMLDPDSVYAVLLEGGKNGIKDTNGVGIKHTDSNNPSINDVWVFKTGEKVCELDAVWIEPVAYLFQTPQTSQNFLAKAISFTYEENEGKEIVPIPGGYDWSWDWGPKDSPLFAIPANGTADSNQISISSTDLEGNITARAIATITTDSAGNSEGRRTIGAAQLVSNFCERLWPPISTENGAWEPYEDNKYNFRMSYCADAGLSGPQNVVDDLPYLFNEVEFLDVSGNCEYSQNRCFSSAECDDYYTMVDPFTVDKDPTGQILISNSGKACVKVDGDNILYPPSYGSEYRFCEEDIDCQNEDGSEGADGVCRFIDTNGMGTQINNSCIGITTEIPERAIEQTVAEDTLKKVVFFNDKNEDLFGLQILENANSLPLRQWFDGRFGNSPQFQSLSIAGYEALTDGNTYYVNAMNIENTDNPDLEEFYKIYNNIYIFSVNDQAQTNTREVLEQLIDSLEFNINMNDYGYCLNVGADLHVDPLDYNSDYPCDSDFECVDENGNVLDLSLSGVCSSARRKFDRDIERLQDIQSIQKGLQTGAPSLEGGTYIPSYTVSLWPSWSRNDGLNMSQYLDPLNIWTSCEGDSQTCWNGSTLEFYCPKQMSIYEYKYDPQTKNYDLYANLEYFRNEALVEKYFDDYIISPESFTIGRHCIADEKYTPHVSSCGDGVVGAGEKCDPPGKFTISNQGFRPGQEGSCNFVTKTQSCYKDEDCGISMFFKDAQDSFVPMTSNQKVCSVTGAQGQEILLYGNSQIQPDHDLLELSAFSCQSSLDCMNAALEYDGDINMFGTNTKISDKTEITESTFTCGELSVADGYSNGGVLSCVGGQVAGFGQCFSGEIASSICNNSCVYDYGTCKPPNDCGNGIVESGETCDDGNLNGMYGHCANDCQGAYLDYCGDGELQFDIEFCDWSAAGKSIWAQNQADSCAFNCKGYGGWCGDNIRQPDNEECDDGNDNDVDGCRSDCYKTRYCSYSSTEKACITDEECPLTELLYNKKVNNSEDLKVCTLQEGVGQYYPFYKEELQNQEIVPFTCNTDQDCYKEETYSGFATDKTIFKLNQSGVQEFDFIGDDFFLQDLGCKSLNETDVFEDYYNISCSEERVQIAVEETPKETIEVGCGNGIIENEDSNPDLNPNQWEECDFGDQNGLACTPSYGHPCTYCSASCRTIQVDPTSFCGDNKFETEYEKCDYIDGVVVTLQGENICTDKGEWQCLNNCQEPKGTCVDCGISQAGVQANLLIINPITMHSLDLVPITNDTLFWEQLDNFENPLHSGGFVTLLRPTWNDGNQVSSMKYYNTGEVAYKNNNILALGDRLETDLQCRDEYYLYFNKNGIEDETGKASLSDQYEAGLGDLFEYPVADELAAVNNTVIYSPAVPRGAFRIVVKWTDTGHNFFGGFFTEDEMVYYSDFAPSGYCYTVEKQNGYWMPACNGNVGDYLFFHSQLDNSEIHLNSYTVDTNQLTSQQPIGFFVQSVGTDRIGNNQNKFSDLQVDVYEYSEGQNPTFSVYKPTRTYTIRDAATTSSNQLAKYWHVFNLEYTNGRYQIEEKQSIETDECELKQSVYYPIVLDWCQ